MANKKLWYGTVSGSLGPGAGEHGCEDYLRHPAGLGDADWPLSTPSLDHLCGLGGLPGLSVTLVLPL